MKQIFYITLAVVFTACAPQLVVLHTNDTHSRVEPTSTGEGGYARRKTAIDSIRSKHKNVLLLDAGDWLQGTPYFNFYRGKVEVEAMNKMVYDAVCLGNHEFDNGVKALANNLNEAEFPIVCSNYKVEGTVLEKFVKPYLIVHRGKIKIGIIGLGIKPEGLISAENFEGIHALEPVETANKYAAWLKKEETCDIVICLSHLGTDADKNLAKNTYDIDLIIGGHSHELIRDKITNRAGKTVTVVQNPNMGTLLGVVVFKKTSIFSL